MDKNRPFYCTVEDNYFATPVQLINSLMGGQKEEQFAAIKYAMT